MMCKCAAAREKLISLCKHGTCDTIAHTSLQQLSDVPADTCYLLFKNVADLLMSIFCAATIDTSQRHTKCILLRGYNKTSVPTAALILHRLKIT